MKQYFVKDWMTKEVMTTSPSTRLPKAHRMMTDKKIRRLPVVEQDKLVGILTIGDAREAEPSEATSLSIWEINYLLDQMTVEQVMTQEPIAVGPEVTISEAAKIMLQNKISGLPVVENGNLVGIITESDIFRLVIQGG